MIMEWLAAIKKTGWHRGDRAYDHEIVTIEVEISVQVIQCPRSR